MKLTTKGRYAVTAMLDLAIHDSKGPVSLAEISLRQGISLSYLEQLFSRLRKQELVISSRGPGGGYQLGSAAYDISVAAVIAAVNESVDATKCGGEKNCQGEERCLTHELWDDLSDHIYVFLNEISLGDLVKKKNVREVSNRQDGCVIDTELLGREAG